MQPQLSIFLSHTQMDHYITDSGAFSQVPDEYQVQAHVDFPISSPDSDSTFYHASDNSSMSSFQDEECVGQLVASQYLDNPWPGYDQLRANDPPSLDSLNISPVAAEDTRLYAPVPRSYLASDSYHAHYDNQGLYARQLTPIQQDLYDGDDQATPKHTQMPTSKPLDDYPRLMFPTPSELLVDIARRNEANEAAAAAALTQERITAESKSQSQRKARLKSLAQSIGFEPTDPDRMSAHEKKRYYLEALEQYVIYVHEQLRLVNTEPVPLERVSTYRGMNSRSIRTLLVHMEDTARKLNLEAVAEEQVFMDLRARVLESNDPLDVPGQEYRRHSIAYM